MTSLRHSAGALLGVVLLCGAAPSVDLTVPPDGRVETPRRVGETQRASIPRVEVIDSATLRDRGARDLGDALQTLPGIQIVDFPDGRRRIVMDGWTARALLCVNALPVVRGVEGEVDIGELPLSLDEVVRIEIIRQPMGHVYGSQAEGGVINIVTRRLQGTGAGATFLVRALENAPPAGQASAGASYAGEQGGVFGHGTVNSAPRVTPSAGVLAPERRALGVMVGGAFRLHPRVLLRGDGDVRELRINAGRLGERRTLRTTLHGEMLVKLANGDAIQVELRAGNVIGRRSVPDGPADPRVYEQGAWLRYMGQPIGGHYVQVEANGIVEFGGEGVGTAFSRQRIRLGVMAADTWRVNERFALEGALRLESSDAFVPAIAPSLSVRYEPFRHLFLRGSVSAGYRYGGLIPNRDPYPAPIGTAGTRGNHESARGARFTVSYEPDAMSQLALELFRTDFSSSPLVFQAGALSVGTYFAPHVPGVEAYAQGFRAHWVLGHLPGGTGVSVGYQFMPDAVVAASLRRLPFTPRHSTTIRTWWAPAWLQAALEFAAEGQFDRVDTDGKAIPGQLLVHWSLRKTLGPVDMLLAIDDATRTVDPRTGPREGRSIRALLRAATW